jgi:superfamily II DNA or RNA helicase
MRKILIPRENAWVRRASNSELGIVTAVESHLTSPHCRVRWFESKRQEIIRVSDLRSGFKIGMEVQDVPVSRSRRSLGEGFVVETRTLGGRDQVLVEFLERGERVWLPYENLKQIRGVEERFVRCLTGEPGNAERFRLRNLAYAIEMWHENTGSLSQLDIDPLPHQIHLVHHILGSGNLNWMIADDVGLGKTIEVGMLLSALIKRGTHRRILLVTPAGLVNQWKEELNSKFGLGEFRVYGDDFTINEPRHWKLNDHVIGSVDLLKSENHFAILMQAEPWDLVIFDEAHRLSRSQYGMKFESSGRFRLAAALRRQTDSILLLTATPHQGKPDKFKALLEVIRPELKSQIRALEMNYEILRDMIIRNKKSDVTDADGKFIFLGKDTIQVPVNLNEDERKFDATLRIYLREGYRAMAEDGSMTAKAIGFVMTTYRKLASSSIAAIERSLRRRLGVLLEGADSLPWSSKSADIDERYSGEWEETVTFSDAKPFFTGEIEILKDLIVKAQQLFSIDSKKHVMAEQIIAKILQNNPEEKILIFTEYRGTQDYLVDILKEKFGIDKVAILNGSMKPVEREQEIAKFEDTGQFLVSTEAGGEGINLQRECHMMINYDLPWNPMRLVQRVGRLYRYGQKKKVIVFNMNVAESMDGNILDILYQRIESVVHDMASIGDEFRPGLEAEILGELVEALDVEEIMQKSAQEPLARSRESIEMALRRAREAVKIQRDLLEYVSGYNPEESSGEFKVGLDHVKAFVEGVIAELGIEVIETTHKGKVIRIRLPLELANEIGMAGRHMQITLDRDLASRRKDIEMLDLNSRILLYMLDHVKNIDLMEGWRRQLVLMDLQC